jgi:hypothetical protein
LQPQSDLPIDRQRLRIRDLKHRCFDARRYQVGNPDYSSIELLTSVVIAV